MAQETEPVVERREPRLPARFWIGLVIAILAAVFILQNRQTARVQLFVVTVSMPLWIAMTICALAGLLIGLLARRRRTTVTKTVSRHRQ